jgi:hypothetical protein
LWTSKKHQIQSGSVPVATNKKASQFYHPSSPIPFGGPDGFDRPLYDSLLLRFDDDDTARPVNNPLLKGFDYDDDVFLKPPAASLRSSSHGVHFALVNSGRRRASSDRSSQRERRRGRSADRTAEAGRTVSSTLSTSSTTMSTSNPAPAAAAAVVVRPTVPDVYAPPVFRGDNRLEAEEWLKHFNRYVKCKGMSKDEQLAFFPLSLGGSAQDWFDGLGETNSIDAVIAKFKEHFGKDRIDTVLRGKSIFSHEQKPGELTRDYVCTMRKLAKQLTNIDDETLYLATLRGLQPQIRRYVIQQGCKNLEDLLAAARAAELSVDADGTDIGALVAEVRASRADLGKLAAKVEGMAVNSIRQRTTPPPRRSPSPAQSGRRVTFSSRAPRGRVGPAATRSSRCYRCGKDHWGKPCPVINLTCFKCNRRGHVSSACLSGRREQQ